MKRSQMKFNDKTCWIKLLKYEYVFKSFETYLGVCISLHYILLTTFLKQIQCIQ